MRVFFYEDIIVTNIKVRST